MKSKETSVHTYVRTQLANIAIIHHPALYTAWFCSSIQLQLGSYIAT